jgi:hypothetical protein
VINYLKNGLSAMARLSNGWTLGVALLLIFASTVGINASGQERLQPIQTAPAWDDPPPADRSDEAPDTTMGPNTSASEAAGRFVAWARELKSDPDLNLDLRTMVPVFYDVWRRKHKVWAFLGWSRRPITVSFARPHQATIWDLNGRPLRNAPPIRWGALRADLHYPVTAEIYVDQILNRDEFRKVCDSCHTRSEILRSLDASTNPA